MCAQHRVALPSCDVKIWSQANRAKRQQYYPVESEGARGLDLKESVLLQSRALQSWTRQKSAGELGRARPETLTATKVALVPALMMSCESAVSVPLYAHTLPVQISAP
jgi:hypothetical protein